MASDDCWSVERLTLYLEDGLEVEDRARAEEHLSRCRSCRRDLVASYETRAELPEVEASEDLKRAVRDLPVHAPGLARKGAVRWWTALAAAVVVGLGFSVLLREERLGTSPDPETLRAPRVSDLELLTPAAGETVVSATVVFSWSAVPEVWWYMLRVVNALGDVVHRETTSEPRLGVPAASFSGAQEYFWYVTVVLDDGTTLESEVGSFAAPPRAPDIR